MEFKGRSYWTTDLLRRYASESAEKRGMDLEEAVRSVTADETGSVDVGHVFQGRYKAILVQMDAYSCD